ncbi:hypothetical protein M1437_04300 [Patescibacteria group bacterium]|nr:hypothetical protein [Patescibacteria group bacterium]
MEEGVPPESRSERELSPNEIKDAFQELIRPLRERTAGWQSEIETRETGGINRIRSYSTGYEPQSDGTITSRKVKVRFAENAKGECILFWVEEEEFTSDDGKVSGTARSFLVNPEDEDPKLTLLSYEVCSLSGEEKVVRFENTPTALEAGKRLIDRLPQTGTQ